MGTVPVDFFFMTPFLFTNSLFLTGHDASFMWSPTGSFDGLFYYRPTGYEFGMFYFFCSLLFSCEPPFSLPDLAN